MKVDFGGIEWNSYVHTKWDSSRYDNAYFGPEGVREVVNPSYYRLYIERSPKYFTKPYNYPTSNTAESTCKEWCCGELIGQACSYGTFTWRVKMPEYPHVWPALWLCGVKTWPPEIDLVEGYTEDEDNYYRGLFARTTLETNFHKRIGFENGTHTSLGARGIWGIIYKCLHKDIDEYKIVWTPKYVKLYFNGFRIRKMTDKEMLADLNEDHSMNPIMNMMVDNGFELDDRHLPYMSVYSFEYIPMKR